MAGPSSSRLPPPATTKSALPSYSSSLLTTMTMLTRSRSSVLGKRTHQSDENSPSKTQCLPTPDATPNHKRTRTEIVEDGFCNKENIPPYNTDPLTNRTPTSIRRTTTELSLTPRSIRNTPRRTASTSSIVQPTPSTAFSGLTLTPPPTPPTALVPLHVRVRGCLRPTCDNTKQEITGREDERAAIQDFMHSFLHSAKARDPSPASLYVSGSPGTGKTALVHSMLAGYTAPDSSLRVLYINCMAIKDVAALNDRFLAELEPEKTSTRGKKLKGKGGIEEALTNLKSKCILVLDEVDHIASSAASLASIFSLPQCNFSMLRLIAIANTHTLAASLAQTSSVDAGTVQTLHFRSYRADELSNIVRSRLAHLRSDPELKDKVDRFLPAPAITLLVKKVATQTGDVRFLFEVLRGAIDHAVAVANSGADPVNTPPPNVTPAHVLAALKAHTAGGAATSVGPSTGPQRCNSEIVSKIRGLGFQSQVILLAIILALKRSDAGLSIPSTPSKSPKKRSASMFSSTSVDAAQLHSFYTATLSRSEDSVLQPVSRGEFNDVLGLLEGVGLVSLTSSDLPCRSVSASPSKRRKTMSRTSSLSSGFTGRVDSVSLADSVRGEEVLRGLGIDGQTDVAECTDVRMEEVRVLWHQECARLGREVRATERSVGSNANAFEGACEH